MHFELKTPLRIAIEATQQACADILDVYQSGTIDTKTKDIASPVSLAEKQSHSRIFTRLMDDFFHPVISEERQHKVRFDIREQWTDYWLVDPLGATSEFDEFTVSVALIHKKMPVLGVIAIPATGEIYYGTAGGGAHRKHGDSLSQLSPRTPVDIRQSGLRVIASRSQMNEQTECFINHLKSPRLLSIGGNLKYLAVAKGEADLYPQFSPSMEWNTAAAHVIMNEVGLDIKNVFNNEPLHYNKRNLLNPYFVCQ